MLWAVVMAGGQGTRFWPASRKAMPKQFLSLLGQETMIEQTINRLPKKLPRKNILIVTQAEKTALVRKLLKLPAGQVLGEPVGRNTAPCLALAAAKIIRQDPDAVLVMLPSDHIIQKPKVFQKALLDAAAVTQKSGLPVTFGIKPSSAHTGYGYLEMAGSFKAAKQKNVYHLKAFHEKPNKSKANKFFKSKKFLWNSGMFVWRADSLLSAMEVHVPEAYRLAVKITEKNFNARMKSDFKKMPNVSIDYGIMEKLKGRILTMPVDFGWSDVGGWKALSELLPKNKDGNTVVGATVSVKSKGNFVKSKKVVALLGVQDLAIVDTDDALLVCPIEDAENVRAIVDLLSADKKLSKLL